MLHEEVILRWYKDTQEGKAKGKTVFLEQMSTFIEWLKNAEEEGEFMAHVSHLQSQRAHVSQFTTQ